MMPCFPSMWPRWGLMWLSATTIYLACKLLTLRNTKKIETTRWRHAAYLLAWPGMDAFRFIHRPEAHPSVRPKADEWFAGVTNLILGALIFWSATRVTSPDSVVLVGWMGVIGTILILHFGSFVLLSCFWRSLGTDASPLMNRPLRSTSVAEFWGKRWNTAFRDLTFRFLFRPLQHRLRPQWALFFAFFVSGVIHELVISVPAGGGYGGPTLYFCIQAGGVIFERSAYGKHFGLGSGWPGRLFSGLVLVMPLRLLCPDVFLTRVVMPFMKSFGSA